jgi:HAD superfamily hydrolase (TIGR01549 family)
MGIKILKDADYIIWDFDGVIKDSMKVKSYAFEKLFMPFGKELSKNVRLHHENNGGMSRFDKLHIYLELAGQEPLYSLVNEYAEKFSLLVKQKVIDSDWVEGVLDFLKTNHKKQEYFLVTATPQLEIEYILKKLKIENYFTEIIGSPTKKSNAVKNILNKYGINPKKVFMIGDSKSDYESAKTNHVDFFLLKTNLNHILQKQIDCHMIESFI